MIVGFQLFECSTDTASVDSQGLCMVIYPSGVGGDAPTNKMHMGEVISSMDGGRISAIFDGCCGYIIIAVSVTQTF
jgi:hypothetical protein